MNYHNIMAHQVINGDKNHSIFNTGNNSNNNNYHPVESRPAWIDLMEAPRRAGLRLNWNSRAIIIVTILEFCTLYYNNHIFSSRSIINKPKRSNSRSLEYLYVLIEQAAEFERIWCVRV